ncbi:MTRF1L release factor glutamine methyltransferase-like isoform X2 [Clavelina lepadiformis]|uniref:MTRF1L release factor glutamine methyltransferase-like isoform X2 n=1 Tax=Clavelina lepadiformis TaxID=159417 RepID=UPI00404249B3
MRRFLSEVAFRAKPPTVTTKLQEWKRLFEEHNISEPQPSAEFIISHVLGKKTYGQISHADRRRVLDVVEITEIDNLCKKRLTKLPIQYVIEEWDFSKLTLKIKPPVFIPRPETEELVKLVCDDINLSPTSRFSLLELKVFTSDIRCFSETKQCKYDGLVSNPPYIPTNDMKSLQPEISFYESEISLHGGTEGLDVIKEILDAAKHLLKTGGWIWMEVDASHPKLLKNFNSNFYLDKVEKDFLDRERFVKLIKM